MTEEWRAVPGFEEWYEVSSLGRVAGVLDQPVLCPPQDQEVGEEVNKFENMEVFIASEDAVEPIGKADEVEFWTYDNLPGELILHGFNAGRNDLLQAENECLRKDVEFYKNRNTVEKPIEVERELEMGEGEFEDLITDTYHGDRERSDAAAELKVSLIKRELTEAEKIQEFINGWNGTPDFGSLAQHLADAGFTVPDKENVV